MQTPQTISSIAGAEKKGSAPAASQLTSHPYFAILGVLLGALTSVFTGRLLSVGLADVQGAIGASSDAMSWVSTSYNAALMFIGPVVVFLGGIFGARRVLLWASAVFMVSEFLSPLVAHNVGALIAMQIVAGLSSGTYYPLTFTLIIRSLPLKYLPLGLAAYALDILGSTHIATALESWYMNHLSWQWIFWNALFVTPILMLCIYYGAPRQPMPQRSPRTNLWGFLYVSAAFTFLYCALDQGERLDWLNSGVINACFATAAAVVSYGYNSTVTQPV